LSGHRSGGYFEPRHRWIDRSQGSADDAWLAGGGAPGDGKDHRAADSTSDARSPAVTVAQCDQNLPKRPMTTDILIVGGGIGGLVLAELLGRDKKRVVVLERSTGPPKWNRPEGLWPVTAQVMSTLLPKSQLDEAVLLLEGVQLFDGEQFR